MRGDRSGTRLPRTALAVEEELVLLQELDAERCPRGRLALLLGVARERRNARVARGRVLALGRWRILRLRKPRLGRRAQLERRCRDAVRPLDRLVERGLPRLDIGADPRELVGDSVTALPAAASLRTARSRDAPPPRLLRALREAMSMSSRVASSTRPERGKFAPPLEGRRRRCSDGAFVASAASRAAAWLAFDRAPTSLLNRSNIVRRDAALAIRTSAVSTSSRSASTVSTA
jgi:hypothetical protein